MNSMELEAGKMELVQAIAGISNPEILAKARKALNRIIHSSEKAAESTKAIKDDDEDPMPGGIPALQFTREELIAQLRESEEDRKAGRCRPSADVFRSLEEKYPFLCE